jgi:hypothetical protein
VVNTLVRADIALLRGRPQLVAGKYRRMAGGLYSFYRGNFPLFVRDAGDGWLGASEGGFGADALPIGMGDAHPENFGTMVAPDGTMALEPNDFDAADRYPYLWELRRLCVGMVVAARASNINNDPGRTAAIGAEWGIARACASGYAERIVALRDGAPPERIEGGAGNPIVADLFERALEDLASREELRELTVVGGGVRTLRRGGIDADEPENVLVDLPAFVHAPLVDTLRDYRTSLAAPPPEAFFTVLDAVRELGGGVGSWPRIRILVLVRGGSDALEDDVVLELKELADTPAEGWVPPGVSFDSVQDRVMGSSRRLWARPDAEPLWGTSTLVGFPVQLKREAEAHKTVRVERFVGSEGTPDAIRELARLLGGLLARMHATDEVVRDAVAEAIAASPDAFADEQAGISVAYADQVGADLGHLRSALERLGPVLGVRAEDEDRPSPEIAALYGTPPEAP